MEDGVRSHDIASIGTVAGVVWQQLDQNGPVTLSRLARDMEFPRDLVMQAVGWLAREGKVEYQEGPRSKLISLT